MEGFLDGRISSLTTLIRTGQDPLSISRRDLKEVYYEMKETLVILDRSETSARTIAETVRDDFITRLDGQTVDPVALPRSIVIWLRDQYQGIRDLV
jgi:hypothetical protein